MAAWVFFWITRFRSHHNEYQSQQAQVGWQEAVGRMLELNLWVKISCWQTSTSWSAWPHTAQHHPPPSHPPPRWSWSLGNLVSWWEGGDGTAGVNETKVKYNCLILQNDTSESYLSRETDTIELAGRPALYWVWSSGQMADLGVIKITQS